MASFTPLGRGCGDSDVYIKIILLGDAGTGKTSLMMKYTDVEMNGNNHVEHSMDTANKTIQRDEQTIHLEIRDTAGMERYRSLTKSHYNGASGALVLFDLTDEKTFNNVTHWLDDLRQYCDHPDRVQVMLVGTGCHDNDRRAVSTDKIARMAEHFEAASIEISIRDDINVSQVFDALVDRILDGHPNFAGRDDNAPPVFLEYSSAVRGREDDDERYISCAQCCAIGGDKPHNMSSVR